MKVTIEVTPQQLANVFTTAIESGDPVTTAARGGWCAGIYWQTKSAKPPSGLWYNDPKTYEDPDLTLEIHEVDDEVTGHITVHTVDAAKIEAGLAALAAEHGAVLANILNDNDDAGDADTFLQIVVFGELVYG